MPLALYRALDAHALRLIVAIDQRRCIDTLTQVRLMREIARDWHLDAVTTAAMALEQALVTSPDDSAALIACAQILLDALDAAADV